MPELTPPKWKQLNHHQRIVVVNGINAAFANAIEVDIRNTPRGIYRYQKIRADAKTIERLAWACWDYCVTLDEKATWHRDLLEAGEYETLLEQLCLGQQWSLFEYILQVARTPSEAERQAAENMEEGLNAWLEADYFIREKGHAFRFLSYSAIRVLNAFDPTSRGRQARRSLVIYTGAFETNRRRH